MIEDKKSLDFYMKADLMMNRGRFRNSLCDNIKNLIISDDIIHYLRLLRKLEYYGNRNDIYSRIRTMLIKRKYLRKGARLGFSISYNVFGYGLTIPHYGTIVVGTGNSIGNYCVLHTSTCITNGNKSVGDGMYLSSGAILTNDISLGSKVSIGANSLVNKTIAGSGLLVAGSPAECIKDSEAWWDRDGEEYARRHELCEKLYKDTFEK